MLPASNSRSDSKKDVIQERMKTERRKVKEKQEEELYEKEERDQMALEMYDKWMVCTLIYAGLGPRVQWCGPAYTLDATCYWYL